VVYKEAGHAFNLEAWGDYRVEDAADSWQRTTKMLGRYQPLR
jgi:dienelactone hydrolase